MTRPGHDFGYYDAPFCGGVMERSGKGSGARCHGTRHQAVLAFPSWGGRVGSDVYFSSRWDNAHQTYDHFVTPKSVTDWWRTPPWEWVFVQEVPMDVTTKEFLWDEAKKDVPSAKTLAKKRRRQKKRFFEQQRAEAAAWTIVRS